MTAPVYFGATLDDLRVRLTEPFLAGLSSDGASRAHLHTQPSASLATLPPQTQDVLSGMLALGEREVRKQTDQFELGESAWDTLKDYTISIALYFLYKRQGYGDKDNPFTSDFNRSKAEMKTLQHFRLGGESPIAVYADEEESPSVADYPAWRRTRMGL